MTIEAISEFLTNGEREAEYLKQLSKEYSINDFVMVDKDVKPLLDGSITLPNCNIYGCLYNKRKGWLCLETDTVEQRLTNVYLDFLIEVIRTNDEIDKVQYILAYHYLTYLLEMGFLLAGTSDSPFPHWGNEFGLTKRNNYKEYLDIRDSIFHRLISYISEDDIIRCSRLLTQYRTQHNVKHFSLIEYVLGCEKIVGTFEINSEFVDMVDLFVFRYRAIFTAENMWKWVLAEDRERIEDLLVEL